MADHWVRAVPSPELWRHPADDRGKPIPIRSFPSADRFALTHYAVYESARDEGEIGDEEIPCSPVFGTYRDAIFWYLREIYVTNDKTAHELFDRYRYFGGLVTGSPSDFDDDNN
jgi:hypothetical protein